MKQNTIYRGTLRSDRFPYLIQLGIDAGIARTRRDSFLAAARQGSERSRAFNVKFARLEHRHFMLLMKFVRQRLARNETP